MERLCERVEQVLASNQDMGRRLRDMDHDTSHRAASTVTKSRDDAVQSPAGQSLLQLILPETCRRLSNAINSASHLRKTSLRLVYTANLYSVTPESRL